MEKKSVKKIPTKDKILLAALELFSEKGYDYASIDELAAMVGIKGPSIYAHYKGKEDILDSLIAMMEKRYDDNFGSISNISAIPDTPENFKADCMKRIEFTLTDPQIIKVRKFCVKEQFRSAKIAALTTKHQITGNQKIYSFILGEMIKKGIIKKADPDILAMELIMPITLLVGIADREPDRIDEVRKNIDMHLEHFIDTYSIK